MNSKMPKIENLNIIFKDEQGTDLNKYGITESNGLEKQVKLRRLANITQVGTPLNAKNLNLLKDKINEVVNKANTNETEIDNANQAITDKVKQTLKEAKTYTDSLETKVSETYETKTDATAKLESAKSYSDTNKQNAITSANSYTDTKVKKAIEDLNTSGDTNLGLAKTYTDQKVSEGVKEAKSYTDEQFKKINDNLIATVDCSHKYEITGNTGDEHGLAIDDQQMLIKKIQGHSRRKSLNLFSLKPGTYGGVTLTYDSTSGIYTFNGTSTGFSIPLNNQLLQGQQISFIAEVVSGTKTGAQNDISVMIDGTWIATDWVNTKTLSESISGCWMSTDITYTNYKVKINVVEGTYTKDTMPPFQPYDNTLVNSNNTLISTGRNLVDINEYAKGRTKQGQTTNVTDYPKLTCSSTGDARLWNFKSADYYLSLPKGQYKIVIDNLTRVENYSLCNVFLPNGIIVASSSLSVGKNVINLNLETDNIIGIMSKMPNSSFNIGLFFKDENNEYEYKQDVVQAPSLGEFDYYQEGKIYRQTSQVVTLNGSENWGIDSNSPNKRFYYRPVDAVDNVDAINVVSNNLKEASANDTYSLSQENNLISVASNTIHIVKRDFTTVDQLKQWLQQNPIQLVYKLATPTIEDYAIPSGYAVYNGGLQIQQGDVPYTITKQYNLSQKAQILANVEIDREQQKQIDEVNNKIINLPSPSITNRTVKNISINNTFPQTLTSEQTKDVFNNDLFVILSVGGSQNFYEYKNVIENPSEGKTFINISPGMKDDVSENVSFNILYVASNGYIRKESFQINKFPVYQHSILITDEKDTRILCSIVAKKSRAISTIPDLKYLINASGLRVVCNGFVKPTLTHQGGMAFELNTQSGDVKVKYVNLGNSIDYISDVALNSISNLKIIDTVYDYTVANG